MGMIKCSECGQMISDKAVFCPQCGKPVKKNEKKYVTVEQGIIALLVIALILVIVLPGPWKNFNAPNNAGNSTGSNTTADLPEPSPVPDPEDYEMVPLLPEDSVTVPHDGNETESDIPDESVTPTEPESPTESDTPSEPEVPAQPETPTEPETPTTPTQPEPEVYTWNGNSSLDFTAYTNLGESFTLSNQAGNVVLLNFWATWCGPCVGEMPALQKLYEEYGDDNGVRIITIEIGESSETVHRFLSQNGYTMPCIYDTDYTISDKYNVSSIPYTVIFGKDGKIRDTFTGAADADTQYMEYHSVIVEALND